MASILELDQEAMAVPAEAAKAVHGLVAGDDVLDGTGEDVAIVGLGGGEGRAIVEDAHGIRLRSSLQLGLEDRIGA